MQALFLKKFSGEVLTTFGAIDVITGLHTVRNIENGKSAQFPAIGNITAAYHTPGTEMTGNRINHAEMVINIDQLCVAHTTIANIDEAVNHYDVRSQYTEEIAKALYDVYARRVFRVIARAARTDSPLSNTTYATYGSTGAASSGNYADSSLADANAKVTASVLIGKIWKSIELMDNKNVPSDNRFAAMKPAQYYLILQNAGTTVGSPLNKDWGGSGSYAAGNIAMIGGVQLVKSVQFCDSDITTDSAGVTGGNNYNGDFSKTAALVFHTGAAGTVKLLDVSSEAEYSATRQGTFMVSKYSMGHGVLRPWCACEITTGTITDQTKLTPSN